MSLPQYAIGIDLGTTNTVLAYVSLMETKEISKPKVLEITQFVAPSIIEERRLLPSFLYIGTEEERKNPSWKLPWDSGELESHTDLGTLAERQRTEKKGFFQRVFGRSLDEGSLDNHSVGVTNPNALYLVGEIAKHFFSECPDQVVSSAKSWLTYTKIDRKRPILPWGIGKDKEKVSPIEASKRYLAHLVSAWNCKFPNAPIFDQLVILTVPASFDESARELTREAAVVAGLNPDTLLFLEEPLAALYAWLSQEGHTWRNKLKLGDVILVCDVGGGTTDLSLIRVEEDNGALILNRLAVGKRLLLGGDNIDLAIAYKAAILFEKKGIQLNPWQSTVLQQKCRIAKEFLLDTVVTGTEESTYKLTIEGRSNRLVGQSVSVDLSQKEIHTLVSEGFFPVCELNERVKHSTSIGFKEIGLPYESDPAITKHIASFLKSHCINGQIEPNWFLLNGGVFSSKFLQNRVHECLQKWFPEQNVMNLSSEADIEGAVAMGASYYGLAKLNGGERIRGTLPRAYYIGVESSGLAIPGVQRPLKVLCVAPIGMEEGSEADISTEPFELVVGESAFFRFFSSTTRKQDQLGEILDYHSTNMKEDLELDIQETDPIETTLPVGSGDTNDLEYIAVTFHTNITELGALEVWCKEIDGTRRWKLEFNIRED